MSAKHAKKKAAPAAPSPAPTAPLPTPAAVAMPAPAVAAAAPAGEAAAWIDSTDPRKRKIGQFVLIGVWIYVGALWLLALDQTFNWGLFGPKIPPLP